MTIGQCLEVIRENFLNGDSERMTKVGMNFLRKLKTQYYDGDYPRCGWFVVVEGNSLFMRNQEVIVSVGKLGHLKPKRSHNIQRISAYQERLYRYREQHSHS